MGRSVADTALMLSVLARADRNDPYTIITDGKTPWDPSSFATLPRVDLSSLKIAVTEDYDFAPTESIVRDHFRKVMPQLATILWHT